MGCKGSRVQISALRPLKNKLFLHIAVYRRKRFVSAFVSAPENWLARERVHDALKGVELLMIDIGKRETEREHLDLFLEAYGRATGEALSEMRDCETPDFVGCDANGRVVGIEITTLRFSPDERHWRCLFPPVPDDSRAWFRMLELLRGKGDTLSKGRWPQCERKILVIMTVDATISDIVVGDTTDAPDEGGFDEVWLADYTQGDAFNGVDLFAVVHRTLRGHFSTGNRGQKPYG
jgi:hypothetical protein